MVGSDTVSSKPRALKGRDLITIGIFTALYFVVNFACMLVSGLHPYLWVFMPAIDALLAGIPFMLACAKVPKFGTVLVMGMVPSLVYFVTGMFTPLILGTMLASCLVAEVVRAATEIPQLPRQRPCLCGLRLRDVRKPPAGMGVPRLVHGADLVSGDGCRLSGNARSCGNARNDDRDVRHDFRLRTCGRLPCAGHVQETLREGGARVMEARTLRRDGLGEGALLGRREAQRLSCA